MRSSTQLPTALAVSSGGGAALGVAQRIADQVHNDPFQDRRVGHDLAKPGRDIRLHGSRLRSGIAQRSGHDLTQICWPGKYRQRPGLQPARVQQILDERAKQIEGFRGSSQQFVAVAGGEASVARAQAAHRRLGCGERRAEVVANRREQRRPPSVGLPRPGGLPGQVAEQDQPPRPASLVQLEGERGELGVQRADQGMEAPGSGRFRAGDAPNLPGGGRPGPGSTRGAV